MNVAKECIKLDNCSGRQADRNEYLDIVKFVLIFFVVWGHVIQCTAQQPTWPEQIDPLFRFIYTAHMPLFMGLCGYFFCKSLRKWNNIREYVKNKLSSRILGLFVPMLVFGFFKVLLSICEGNYTFSFTSFPFYWLTQARGIWFLGDLAVNTLITLCLWHMCKGQFKHDWKFLILGVPLACIPKITYISPHMYLYFMTGFIIAAYVQDIKKYIKYWPMVFVLFIGSYICFSNLPWAPLDFTLMYKKYTPLNLIVNDILKLILGFTGSYLIMLIVYKMLIKCVNGKLIHKAAFVGTYTLDIYLLQIIMVEVIFRIVNNNYIIANGIDLFNFTGCFGMLIRIMTTFVVSIIIIEIILAISKCINKNKVVSKLLFYR